MQFCVSEHARRVCNNFAANGLNAPIIILNVNPCPKETRLKADSNICNNLFSTSQHLVDLLRAFPQMEKFEFT